MLRVQLLIHVHGGGLRRNVSVWKRVLKAAGFSVTVTPFEPSVHKRALRGVRKTIPRLTRRPLYDVNIFDETIVPDWFHTARVNCLSPHQEWFSDAQRFLLPQLDWVLCKTHYAETVFRTLGCKTQYSGFTTDDRFDHAVKRDYGAFLHVAGSSMQKGTAAINAAWLRHPEWPSLKVYWHEPNAAITLAPNITWTKTKVPEPQLVYEQNACGIHLCPSEAEGLGHYLLEGMACKALVVTTDAPPMNELVTPDRGLLVRYHRTAPQGVGTNFYVDAHDLEHAVKKILAMDEAQRRTLGEQARVWYLDNDRKTPQRVKETLEGIC